MTPSGIQAPSALDRWLMRRSTLVLASGVILFALGAALGTTAGSDGGIAALLQWVAFVPAALLVGFAGRARSMAKRSREE